MPLILLVEDHAETLDIYRTIFGVAGHETIEASDGPTGLHLALSRLPALVILDIGLPEMDGWTVLEQLRADPRGQRIPVLVVTAHGDAVERGKLEDTLCQGTLLKPIHPRELVRKAEECIEQAEGSSS